MKLSANDVKDLEEELKKEWPSLAYSAIITGRNGIYNDLVRSRNKSGMSRWAYNATLILFYLAAHDSCED